MGYYVYLRRDGGCAETRAELGAKLERAGIESHPYSASPEEAPRAEWEHDFLIVGGLLTLSDETEITRGELACVRFSYGAQREAWEELLGIAEVLDCTVYAEGKAVTRETLQAALAEFTEAAETVKGMLGFVGQESPTVPKPTPEAPSRVPLGAPDESLEDIDFSVRTCYALENGGLETLRDLCRFSERELRALGVTERSLAEIQFVLVARGLCLRD